jgi:hypothetical protein
MRTIRRLIVVLVVLLVVAFAYPLAMEGTGSECDALEKKVLTVAQTELGTNGGGDDTLAFLVQGAATKGRLMEAWVRQRYSSLPPAAACTLGYWRTLIDPGWMRRAATGA